MERDPMNIPENLGVHPPRPRWRRGRGEEVTSKGPTWLLALAKPAHDPVGMLQHVK